MENFDGCSQLTTQNKHGNPIFSLHFFNVLYMTINCDRFKNILDSPSFSRKIYYSIDYHY